MKTPKTYREDAKRCRELLDRPLEPEVRIQLRLWAAELDDMADAIECGHLASLVADTRDAESLREPRGSARALAREAQGSCGASRLPRSGKP